MSADQDLLVDVDIPGDIQLGFDPDGLPKTDATPVVTKAPAEPAVAPAAPAVKPDDGPKISASELDALRKQAYEAQQERDRLGREAQEAKKGLAQTRKQLDERTDQAMRAHWERVNANLDVLKGGIATAQSIATQAEHEYTAAREANDTTRELAAHRALARAEAEMVALEQAKSAAEAEVERTRRAFSEAAAQPAKATVAPAAEPTAPAKPRTPSNDEWIAASPKATQSWLRENVNLVSDETTRRRLVNFAEGYILEHGPHNLDTPEFVQALADKFTPKKREEAPVAETNDDGETVDVSQRATPTQSKTATAAPVSRGPTPTKPSGQKMQVRLSPAEQTIAPQLYPDMDPVAARRQYAIDKYTAEQEGRYQPRN